MICLICNKEFGNYRKLSAHLKIHNINSKNYYDKYLKNFNEGICLNCCNQTQFISINKGYNLYCSRNCSNTSEVSDKTKIKMSNSAKEKFNNMTKDEIKEYLKLDTRTYNLTNEGREKIRKTCRNNFIGHKKTEKQLEVSRTSRKVSSEAKIKISQKLKGRKVYISEQHKEKLSKASKKQWKTMSDDKKNKIIEAMQSKAHTLETRNKVMESFYKNSSIKTSKPQLFLYNLLKEKYPLAELNYPYILEKRLIDIFVPELNLCIEYDGMYWHNGNEKYDFIKNKECQKLGYKTLNFRMYEDCYIREFYFDVINQFIESNKIYSWIEYGKKNK